jgi:hypothetical protein
MTHHDPAHHASRGRHDAPPSGPFGERGTRILKWAVVIMGIMLVVGFIAVIFIIALRAVQLGEPGGSGDTISQSPHGFARLDVEIERNTLISQIELNGDRMAIHVTHDAGDEIILIDIRTGQLLGRVRLVEGAQAPAQ